MGDGGKRPARELGERAATEREGQIAAEGSVSASSSSRNFNWELTRRAYCVLARGKVRSFPLGRNLRWTVPRYRRYQPRNSPRARSPPNYIFAYTSSAGCRRHRRRHCCPFFSTMSRQ